MHDSEEHQNLNWILINECPCIFDVNKLRKIFLVLKNFRNSFLWGCDLRKIRKIILDEKSCAIYNPKTSTTNILLKKVFLARKGIRNWFCKRLIIIFVDTHTKYFCEIRKYNFGQKIVC